MPIELADGVSYCVHEGRIVFLDIVNDRYCAANARSLSAEHSEADLVRLARHGLITGTGALGPSIRPVAASFAKYDAVPWGTGNFAAGWLSALIAQMRATWLLRRRGLYQTLSHLLLHKTNTTSQSVAIEDSYIQVVRAFKAIAPLFDQNRSCLSRSIAMMVILKSKSLAGQLVIGVKLDPFAAHAWVQANDIVLNDTIERIRHYQPIAVF